MNGHGAMRNPGRPLPIGLAAAAALTLAACGHGGVVASAVKGVCDGEA